MLKIQTKKQWWAGLLGMGLSLLPVATNPVWGAERIYLSFGGIERSVSIAALELYAREGEINSDLKSYTRYFDDQQLDQLRVGLQSQVDLDAVSISQFLYSPTGERLLRRLGQIIQTPSGQPGFYAIRAALILAASEPQGLTALSVLHKFPTYGIRVDLGQALAVLREVESLVDQTAIAVAAVRNQAPAQENNSFLSDQSQFHGLEFRGPFSWQQETLKFEDASRVQPGLSGTVRTFLADIYLPKVPERRPLPVLVFSHGLGADRLSYQYLAQNLASYGFVVAVPEHPGSGSEQLLALLDGEADDVAEPTEFVDRPLDIKFLLDELQRRSQSDSIYYGRLNLKQVGVIGHSFGGYTALALAGAKLNFEQLQQDCGNNLDRTLNASLLLQCRALALPRRDYNLSDPRIKSVVAINPIDSSLFGQSGLRQIQVPVMLIAATADTVAPALLEQIQPFNWLNTPQKYLAVIEGATHFSTTGELSLSTGVFPIPAALVGPTPSLARSYLSALSVAFFQTYVTDRANFARYLTPEYTTAISQAPLRLSISQTLIPTGLESTTDGLPEVSTPAAVGQ